MIKQSILAEKITLVEHKYLRYFELIIGSDYLKNSFANNILVI